MYFVCFDHPCRKHPGPPRIGPTHTDPPSTVKDPPRDFFLPRVSAKPIPRGHRGHRGGTEVSVVLRHGQAGGRVPMLRASPEKPSPVIHSDCGDWIEEGPAWARLQRLPAGPEVTQGRRRRAPKKHGDGAPGWSPCCVKNGPITANHRRSPAKCNSAFSSQPRRRTTRHGSSVVILYL